LTTVFVGVQPVLSKTIMRTRARIGPTERQSFGGNPFLLSHAAVAKGDHGLDDALTHRHRRTDGAIRGSLRDYRDLRIAGLFLHLVPPLQ
jgi:hypothetical protein